MSLSLIPSQAQHVAIHCRSRQGNDPDWGLLKDTICQLYATNKLKDVMRIMEEDHKFKASAKLYKTKFREWDVDTKRIKPCEYKAMLKKKRKRDQEEPRKVTKFQLHGECVPDFKIARWETRMLKQAQITNDDTFSQYGTPPGLTYRTPTPTSSSPISKVSVLHSPPVNSTTPLSMRSIMRSPTLVTYQQDELAQFSLFSGSIDEFISMDASTHQYWRAHTPIVVSHHSPILNNSQPTFTLGPSSRGIMSSPVLNAAERAIARESLLRSPTPLIAQWNEPDSGLFHSSAALNEFNLGAVQTVGCVFPESISRLIQLVNEKEITVESNHLFQLRGDLQTLLKYAQIAKPLSTRPTKFLSCYEAGKHSDVLKELKLANSLLSAAPSMAVNCNTTVSPFSSSPPGVIVTEEHKKKMFNISGATLIVTTTQRQRRRMNYHHDEAVGGFDDVGGELIAKFFVKSKTSHTMLTVSVNQGQKRLGSSSGIPRLYVNNILPSSSLVFQIAATGRVEDLVSLLAEGKASLRDHDTEGQSLLHFAKQNPTMCQFLVNKGLDVDEVSTSYTPLHAAYMWGACEVADILLEAGADPTIRCPGWINVLHLVSHSRHPQDDQMLRQIFRLSSHFGLSTARAQSGDTPLLRACKTFGGKYPNRSGDFDSERNVQKLELLLREGCSIHDRDNNGLTCLHVFFISLVHPPSDQNWKDSLIYLIRQGADPYALDYLGRSVSYLAYLKGCLDCVYSLGTYRGDLFDAVLDCCGYNISEFRKGNSWKIKHDSGYRRRDFELLWEGREDRCPNWSDTELPVTSQNNIEWGRRTVICICGGRPCYSSHDNDDDDDDDDDSEQEVEIEVNYTNEDDDDDDDQSEPEVELDYNDNFDDDNSENCNIQGSDSQAFHDLHENEIGTAEAQPSFSTTNNDHGELPNIENDSSAQEGLIGRNYQHNQGQESHEPLASVWQLTDQYHMDWTNAGMDALALQGLVQYQGDDQHTQGQGSHKPSSSVWQLTDQYHMDWTDAGMDAPGLQGFSQYLDDDQPYGQQFGGSWGNG